MIAPNVDDIQSAKDRLIDDAYLAKNKTMLESQQHELQSAMWAQSRINAFCLGYQLGVEAVRVVMERNGITINGVPM